jgi:hypothetical protein
MTRIHSSSFDWSNSNVLQLQSLKGRLEQLEYSKLLQMESTGGLPSILVHNSFGPFWT